MRAGSLDSRTDIAAMETVNNYSNLMLAKNRIAKRERDDNPPTPTRFERLIERGNFSDSDRSSSYINGSGDIIRQRNAI